VAREEPKKKLTTLARTENTKKTICYSIHLFILTHPRGNASIALSSSFVVDQFELDPTQTEYS